MSHNSSVAMAIKAPQRRGKHGSGADDAPIRRGGVGAGMSTSGDLLIGVDIGGTFTDVVVRRPDGPISSMAFPGLKGTPEQAIVGFLAETRAALRPLSASSASLPKRRQTP